MENPRQVAEPLALLFALGVLACRAPAPDLALALHERPREYWVIAPFERECLPELQLLLEHKRAAGLRTQIVGFDPEAGPERTWSRVRTQLRMRPGTEPAYLLVLATPDELSMGPWKLEECGTRVESDLPLALELSLEEAREISNEELARAPRWIVGRIPYRWHAPLVRALRSATEYGVAGRERTALLGARRFLLPGDSSGALARAKHQFVRAGVSTELWADGPPRDRALGEHWVTSERTVLASIEGGEVEIYEDLLDAPQNQPVWMGQLTEEVSPDFLERWIERAPSLVYLLAHSATGLHSMGSTLISTSILVGLDGPGGRSREPARPALLLATGCAIGSPRESLVRELFRRGLIAACAASTAHNGPLPLGPALDAQSDVAAYLAHGVPLGVAVAWTKRSYERESRRTIVWNLWPFAREIWATNLASYVVYGDPSLALPSGAR